MGDGAQLKSVGQNSVEEFAETILYQVGYNEFRSQIQDYTKDISSPVMKDAIESAMNVLVFGALFYAIQKQEALIGYLFDKAEIILTALLVAPANRALNKLKHMKGMKLFRKMGFFQNSNQENIMTAQIVATHSGFKNMAHVSNGRAVEGVSAYNMQLDTKNSLIQTENHHMQFGNAMASRYNETLLFKLFTKSFTANDETLIKKIIGRDTGTALDYNDLNQVADFLFVKDTNGKVTGLSEAFFSLINGLGYVHNK